MRRPVEEMFSGVEDPRVAKKVKHKLEDILFIAFCTFLSNGSDFEDMVSFAEERYDWLRKFISLENGIPSHDTFNRVFQKVKPESLLSVLQEDGAGLLSDLKGKHISFDGKKARGYSPRTKGTDGLFIVSAWVNEHQLTLGQQKVEDKSNEKTAIPQLIESLDLRGATISIDAIGTQENIASLIVEKGADYILALKENQKKLFEEVNDGLVWSGVLTENTSTTVDTGHGRKETRVCKIMKPEELLETSFTSKWKGLKTLVRVDYERVENGTISSNTRFYISSKEQTAEYFNSAVRGHWSIENQLHWHLDVTFGEDKNRSRKGYSQENLNMLRKTSLARIKKSNEKLSMQKRRFKASLNQDFLEELLGL